MPGQRGSAPKRVSSNSATLNGHAPYHALPKKRSHQKLDSNTSTNNSTASSTPSLGGRRTSLDVDLLRQGNEECLCERHGDVKRPPGSSAGSSSTPVSRGNGNHVNPESQKRIHVGRSPDMPTCANKNDTASGYTGVLPPHQYLDSLAITFFLINLPSIFLVLVHVLFIMFAVSPYSSMGDRYSSWRTILPAEACIVLFFALVSPAIRAYITELAEPIIASTLAGNGGRGAAICTAVMFVAGRLPNIVLGGFIRLRRSPSPGMLSDTIASAAKGLEGQSDATDRLGDELQAWVLALIRQLIAIHVVARWSWEGLKRYLTNRVNQSKLEDAATSANVDPATVAKRKKALATPCAPRMPLWTTLANNYIVATKDSELKPPEDLRAYLSQNECSLHIQEVTSSTARLCAKGHRERLLSTLGAVDSFGVSVNGLPWREVSVSLDENSSPDDIPETACLTIDIHTLIPATANEIEVTNSSLPDSNILLFHSTICTIKNEATDATPLTPQTVRPNSPVSTLNDKLKNAVDKLNELKNTQKRIRKDHKSTIASLRSENDQLHSRLEAPDKGEERARRGNLAMKYHIIQTEEKIRGVEEDIHNAEETIAARRQELVSGRGKWESELSSLERNHQTQQSTKCSYYKILRQFHADKLAINGRKEKLTAREIKLKSELEILESTERKRDEECDDRARKRREARAQLIKERQASQEEQIMLVEQLEGQLAEIMERTVRTHSDRLAIEKMSAILPQGPSMQSNVVPLGSPSLAMASSLSAGFMDSPHESYRMRSGSYEGSSRGSPVDSKIHLAEVVKKGGLLTDV